MKTMIKSLLTAIIFAAISGATSFAQTGQDVSFVTSDGVNIAGTLWSAGSGSPAVVCLHQWRSDRSSFESLAKLLASNGLTVLTIDARGYGESTTGTGGKTIRPNRDIQKDIKAAIEYLEKNVKPSKTGLLGASYGSSNAVIYASKSKNISALVLLSPGLNYFNVLPTEKPIQAVGATRVLAFASSEDVRSVEAVTRYVDLLGDKISYKIYSNIGHGTDMLSGEEELSGVIKDFLLKALK